ncbi:MAG: hypothetical protein JKY30_13375 [Flavobacteriales bacterium]|nr:hypothetical protein [Flavobacteriales bacterium]
MIRKDYIQRYFDELAKVLAVVLQLKNDLKPTEAATKLNDFATAYLGISFEEILSLKKNHISYLINNKDFSITHFKLLEDLLYHKYLINPSDNQLKKLTLEVLKYVAENDTDFSIERINRIDYLSAVFG